MATLRRNPNQEFEQLKETAAKARLPFDKDMLLNTAFFLDQQYVEWAADWATIRTIAREKGYEKAPRPVANKIMHFVVQEHSSALSNRPQPDVLPATDDPLDVSITGPALAYLRWLSDAQVGDYEAEISEAVFNACVAGEGYLKWFYNPREKRPDFMSVHPLDLYSDPYATRFKYSRWAIHSQFMDVQQVFDTYGVEVKPTKLDRADQQKAALLRDLGQAPVLEGAVVNELWLKPGVSRMHPKGLFVVWTGRDQLYRSDFPYAHARLPFTQVGSIRVPKSPHYTCAVKYMRAPQMELNKYHQQKLMGREAFSNLKWWLPNELEMEQDPDDGPRQILRGNSANGTVKPEILAPPPIPDNRDGDWIRTEMQDIVGQHEVSQAQVPGRVEAAKAIELLKETDASRQAELERTIKLATSEGFWQCLMLAKQFVPDEQIVQTYSREGMPEVKRLKTELLKPGMRVTVTMGTGLTRSRAARADAALNMWERGIIQDPEVMAELLELPVGTISPQLAYDIKLARNENLLIASGSDDRGLPGTALTPNSWDEHAIHIREHNNYRKTQEFAALDGEIKKKFEYHCQMHEQFELKKLAKDAQKQAILAGMLASPESEPETEVAEEPTPSE